MATRKQQQKEGQRQLRKKLKLEKKLTKKMRKFFRRQNRLFKELQNAGFTFDASTTQRELQEILEKHYQDTANVFQPAVMIQVNDALIEAGQPPISDNDPQLAFVLSMFIMRNIRESATAITATSNKEMTSALAASSGNVDEAAVALRKRTIPRSKTISATETQKAAEGSKQVTAEEMERIAAGTAGVIALIETLKTWIDRMDAKVRDAHRFARFQEVPLKKPFIVGGESLMYPGDLSLGASLWNVANCRCSSIQSVRIL